MARGRVARRRSRFGAEQVEVEGHGLPEQVLLPGLLIVGRWRWLVPLAEGVHGAVAATISPDLAGVPMGEPPEALVGGLPLVIEYGRSRVESGMTTEGTAELTPIGHALARVGDRRRSTIWSSWPATVGLMISTGWRWSGSCRSSSSPESVVVDRSPDHRRCGAAGSAHRVVSGSHAAGADLGVESVQTGSGRPGAGRGGGRIPHLDARQTVEPIRPGGGGATDR